MFSLQSGTRVFSSKRNELNNKINWIPLGSRFFPPNFNGSTVKSAVDKPLSAIRSGLNNMINWNPLGSRFFPPKFNGSTVKSAVYKPLLAIRSGLNNKINWNPLASRFFPPKFSGSTVKSAVDKPLSAIRSTLLQNREAVGLQIEAFSKRTYLVVIGFIRAGLCFVWLRVMFGIASTFVGLATAIVTFAHLNKMHHLEELLKQRDVEMAEQQKQKDEQQKQKDIEIATQLKRAEAEMT